MARRASVKGLASQALRADAKLRQATADAVPLLAPVTTADSFVNFAHKMGIGADNALSTASYGFNPITRNRILLEWIHRGSWLGGLAIDIVADDMTRKGIEFTTEIDPGDADKIQRTLTAYGVWKAINETIKWGRLYGGAIAVALIEGQDLRDPLRLNTIGPGQFKGLVALDRWMLEPTLEDVVTDPGPYLGLPKFYRVMANAPVLRNQAIHYSRVMVRHVGVSLPYHQALQEQMWGLSVIERLYDRMVGFDSASTGAAQLVYKAYLRTLSVEGLREVVAAGGKPLTGLVSYVDVMRRYQTNEGLTLIDQRDKLEAQSHGSFSGLSDVLVQFGQQLSGALQIPLVRLFGQSPSGLNSSGESDLRTYYDNISQRQMADLYLGMSAICQLVARSRQVELPEGFDIQFRSLRDMDEQEKGTIAKSTTDTVVSAHESGLITQRVALQELRQSSRVTGIFSNITAEMIEQADDQLPPPPGESSGGDVDPVTGMPMPQLPQPGPMDDQEAGTQGASQGLDQGSSRRVVLQQ